MTIAIVHAFSRKNAGDGLLVDLTLDLLEAAGVKRSECRVLALDAASFSDLRDVASVERVPGEPRGARASRKLIGAAVELARASAAELPLPLPLPLPSPLRRRGGVVSRMLDDDVRGIVAVGGGYLVADSVVRQGGVMLNHMSQLLAAGRLARNASRRVPAIYLPQSIGPLRGAAGALAKRALSRVDVIYARDDETLAELGSITDVRRCPDLAVLRLAQELEHIPRRSTSTSQRTLLVPRELPNAPGYHDLLRRLGNAVPSPLWAVQADVDGPRSDRRFLSTLGVPDAGDLATLLARETPGVVVSVRLHGAIASLLAGWPAIHLSYERKGWGAYQDLGIAEWVHAARTFDVDKVRAQVAALHENPRTMFARIEERVPALREAQRALVDELSRRFM